MRSTYNIQWTLNVCLHAVCCIHTLTQTYTYSGMIDCKEFSDSSANNWERKYKTQFPTLGNVVIYYYKTQDWTNKGILLTDMILKEYLKLHSLCLYFSNERDHTVVCIKDNDSLNSTGIVCLHELVCITGKAYLKIHSTNKILIQY